MTQLIGMLRKISEKVVESCTKSDKDEDEQMTQFMKKIETEFEVAAREMNYAKNGFLVGIEHTFTSVLTECVEFEHKMRKQWTKTVKFLVEARNHVSSVKCD